MMSLFCLRRVMSERSRWRVESTRDARANAFKNSACPRSAIPVARYLPVSTFSR